MALTGGSSNARRIRGKIVSATAPTDTQFLVYSSSTGQWAPASSITATSGALTSQRDGIGSTSTDGVVLANATAAAAGAQQWSPRVRWTGSGWQTNTSTAQVVDWKAELVPVQGAANPQARLDFNYQINAGGYQATPTMSLLNGAVGILKTAPAFALDVAGSIRTSAITVAGAVPMVSGTNGALADTGVRVNAGLITANASTMGGNIAGLFLVGSSNSAILSAQSGKRYDVTADTSGNFYVNNFTDSVIPLHISTASVVNIGKGSNLASVTLGVYDSTASTGVTTLKIQAGAGQSTSSLLSVAGLTGQSHNRKLATTTISAVNLAATITATNLIPAGALVVGVTSRVTTAFGATNLLTSISIGDGTDADRWGANTAITLGSTTDLTNITISSPVYYTAATSVVITANGGTFDATGVIRVTVHYEDLTPSTS